MSQVVDFDIVKTKLIKYKRKYFTDKLIRGSLISLLSILSIFLLLNFAEYFLYLSPIVKTLLLGCLVIVAIYNLLFQVSRPAYYLWLKPEQLSDEAAARQIGKYFPEISDKLVNIIQLNRLNPDVNALVAAGISQKSSEIDRFNWNESIKLELNTKYLYSLLFIFCIGLLAYFISPTLYTDGTIRLIQYDKKFTRPLPFDLVPKSKEMTVFFNEDFTFELEVNGRQVPEEIYLIQGKKKIKMQQREERSFEHTFKNVNADFTFRLSAATYLSDDYKVKVIRRPELQRMQIVLSFPSYLNKENTIVQNKGNIQVPEGSSVEWQIESKYTDKGLLILDKDSIRLPLVNEQMKMERSFKSSTAYEIILQNEYAANKEKLQYFIKVIPDARPIVQAEVMYDSTYFDRVVIGGKLSDDYGLRKLELVYQLENEQKTNTITIPIDTRQNSQSFFYDWKIDQELLEENSSIKYFLRAWDNDGINGSKYGTSETFYLQLPDENVIKDKIEKSTQNIDNQLDKSFIKNQDLQKMLDDADFRIKSKRELNWQDKKLLQDIVEEKNNIYKELEELKEEFKENLERRKQFQQSSDPLQKKAQQLEELINSLQDEETKQLYKELQELLNEKDHSDDYNALMNEIKKQENNLNKDLERTKELFKRLKFELKLEKTLEDIEKLSKEQEAIIEQEEQLSTETEEKSQQTNQTGDESKEQKQEKLKQEQENIKEKFDEIDQDIEDLEELNKDLQKPKRMEDTDTEREDIKELLEQIQQQMQQSGEQQERKEKQKQSQQKMQELQEKMQNMMASMDMQMLNENIDDLRNILDNVLKLSFEQEKLMASFRSINESDPRFVTLSQRQLKLQDDSKVIEDSLQALATRVFQLQSFINKEIAEMNEHMEGAMHHLRERERNNAISKQQFAMTSMNNLALLLDDVLDQLQNMMAEAMGLPQSGSSEGQPMPNMSEMQDQLNQQIQELSQEQRSGRQMSEELMRMAEQQEQIRRQLEEGMEKMRDKEGKDGSEGFQELLEMMEESEKDIVNKRINRRLIERQRQIQTRLLEAEKAMQEQELENERKGETATDYEKKVPKAMEEYIKQKERELELLKTVPPKLQPFYKKEVERYFEQLREIKNE